MIYFYYGADMYRAKETIDALKKKFVELYDPSGHNIERLDAEDFSLERFFTMVKSSGFLSSKKFIVVKNIFSAKEFKDAQPAIVAYLETLKNTKEENYLIFWHEGKPRANAKLFTYLVSRAKPLKCCTEFSKLEIADLIRWVQKEFQKNNKSISRPDAELLIEYAGDDTWRLSREILKLCHTTRDAVVTAAIIKVAVNNGEAETIFPFLDALGARDTRTALQLLNQTLETEQDLSYLISLIIRHYRLLLTAKEMNSHVSNAFAISQKLGIPPFVAKKIMSQSAGYSRMELAAIYGDLVKIDRMYKRDPSKIGAALTMFVSSQG